MDVLYLVPEHDSRAARAVLRSPYNSHCFARQMPLVLDNNFTRRDCLRVSVPSSGLAEGNHWHFKLGSDLDADIRIELADHLGDINFELEFVISQRFPDDPPRLLLHTWGTLNDSDARIYDPMNPEEIEAGFAESLSHRTRVLVNPKSLAFGPFLFHVVMPQVTGDQNEDIITRSRQRCVARSIDDDYPVGEDLRDLGILLGSGGFGVVNLVREMVTGSLRAAKVVKIKSNDLAEKQKVEKEVNMMSSTTHPNILCCFGYRTDQYALPGIGVYLEYSILMRPCHGSLNHLMADQEYNILALSDMIAAQVASALSALHENNIIHRDLKPDNILFRVSGLGDDALRCPITEISKYAGRCIQFFLADFGLARICTLSCDSLVGTWNYWAPEVRGHYDSAYTTRADVYSLGATLLVLQTQKNLNDHLEIVYRMRKAKKYKLIPSYAEFYRSELRKIAEAELEQDNSDMWMWISNMIRPDPKARPQAKDIALIFSGRYQGDIIPDVSLRAVHRPRPSETGLWNVPGNANAPAAQPALPDFDPAAIPANDGGVAANAQSLAMGFDNYILSWRGENADLAWVG